MRRLAAALLVVPLVLSACGSDTTSESTREATGLPTVSGPTSGKPKVADGEGTPPTKLVAKTLEQGDGEKVAKGDLLVAHYVGQTWKGKEFDSSWDRGQPAAFPIGTGQVIAGWDEGLVGVPTGSRVELAIPPAKGYGKQGNPQAGITGKDTLVFVVDVVAAYGAKQGATGKAASQGEATIPVKVTGAPSAQPTVTVEKGAKAPAEVVTDTLVEGDGPAVKKGQLLVAQYVGVTFDDGKTFDSSWQRGQPAAFPIGTGQVIPGWDEGLVGVPTGSRVVLSIPPAKGYGAQGNPQAGISGKDTLVFVVDILGAH